MLPFWLTDLLASLRNCLPARLRASRPPLLICLTHFNIKLAIAFVSFNEPTAKITVKVISNYEFN